MSREQIAEMSVIIFAGKQLGAGIVDLAEAIYKAGYRKQIVAEWVRDNENKPYVCSNCRRFMTFQNLNFCPECGARMRKEDEVK